MTTRSEIIIQFHRLCEVVTEAEFYEWTDDEGEKHIGLLDQNQALAMRQRYRDNADEQLSALSRTSVRFPS